MLSGPDHARRRIRAAKPVTRSAAVYTFIELPSRNPTSVSPDS
jgi:hypothetical protein